MTLAEQELFTGEAAEPREKLWTLEEWDRLVESGFFNGQRLELIQGRIIQMSPQYVPHSVAILLADRVFRQVYAKGHLIRTQLPFRSADGSEPEPDVAIVAGENPRLKQHPSSAVLVVEISDTSLRHDRLKAQVYAASGVPEYWIVNLVGRSVEVYRDPLVNVTPAAYQNSQLYNQDDRISPLGMNVEISVADLLP